MTDRILLNDFQAQWRDVGARALAAVDRVGQSGWLILGKEVKAFEAELARFWGLPHAVGCANGLDALEIALRCLDIAPGTPVLTTPLSAFATTLAIVRAGGEPVFVDVDAAGQLDLAQAEAVFAAHPEVRWMVPVHLYGHALDLARLARLRDRFGLTIVEDCAQAIGARSHEMPVGSVGAIAATSFYPTKNLGCMGDGGALASTSEAHAARARRLRDYGQSARYVHGELGLNSRLDELQAAIMRDALLPELARFTARRREIAARYTAGIKNPALAVPPPPPGSASVWHLYPVLVASPERREAFQTFLHERGVASGVHYPQLIPAQQALTRAGRGRTLAPLARAEQFARCEVSLPIHPYLTDAEVERVIAACNAWS